MASETPPKDKTAKTVKPPSVGGDALQPKDVHEMDPRVAGLARDITDALVKGLEDKTPEEVGRIAEVWSQPNFQRWIGGNPELLLIRYMVGEHWEKFEHQFKGILAGAKGCFDNIRELADIDSTMPGIMKMSLTERLCEINELAIGGMGLIGDSFAVVASLNIAMRAGKTSQMEDVDVSSILEEPLRGSYPSAMATREVNVDVQRELDSSNPTVRADPVLLKAVLLNVFMNSMYAMENRRDKKLQIRTASITEGVERPMVEIRVRDNGGDSTHRKKSMMPEKLTLMESRRARSG